MSPPHILQVITRSLWGGAPRVVESLATRTDAEVEVACGPGGRLIERLEDAGVTVHVQPNLKTAPHPADFLAYRDLHRLIERKEYDLVHSHSTKAGALARLAAFRASIPSVFTVHGWGFYNTEYGALRPVLIRGERYLERCTDEIVCVSENDRRQGRVHGILSADAGTVIHNGIPPLEPPTDRTTLHDEFGIDPETPIIGAIARLAPQKDPLAILETSKRMRDRGHEVATVLLGSGPLAAECQQYVAEHDLENVYMPGFYDDVVEVLPDFDVFLLPSRFEGFPLTVLECLHSGVPVVAYDVGGIDEAIDDGETGFVVPSDASIGTFADHVEQLLVDPRQRETMSSRARWIAETRFTETRMVEKYEDVYDDVLS